MLVRCIESIPLCEQWHQESSKIAQQPTAQQLLSLVTAGDALFQTHENLEHLAMMERVVGKLPDTMTRACKNEVAKHFSPTCVAGAGSWLRVVFLTACAL